MLSLHEIVTLLLQYKYPLLFVFALFEGPLAAIVAGFVVSVGAFGFFGAFLASFLGDMAGDSMYYSLGRFGRRILPAKVRKFVRLSDERLRYLENHFENYGGKTIFFGKASYGLGTTLCLAAGASRYSYPLFWWYTSLISFIKSAVLVALGYFFGKTIFQWNKSIGWTLLAISIVCVVAWLYFLYRRSQKKNGIFNKKE